MHLNAVYASDDNYAPYMGVSMFSLLENNACDFDSIHLYILDNGISEKNRKILAKQASKYHNAEITFHNISSGISEIQPKIPTDWPVSIFGRYFTDEFISSEIDKFLYIDCDTIINRSLKELMETDLGEYWGAGVIDGLCEKQKSYLGLNRNSLYVNSGVLLVNNKKWRSENIRRRLIDFVNSFDAKLIFPDQDAINAVCGEHLLRLPLKYNFYLTMEYSYIPKYIANDNPPFSCEELLDAMDNNYANTVVFHFTGNKPWNKSESSPFFEEIYSRYAKRSLWYKYTPKFRSKKDAFNYYKTNFLISLFNMAKAVVGEKLYNKLKEKYKK